MIVPYIILGEAAHHFDLDGVRIQTTSFSSGEFNLDIDQTRLPTQSVLHYVNCIKTHKNFIETLWTLDLLSQNNKIESIILPFIYFGRCNQHPPPLFNILQRYCRNIITFDYHDPKKLFEHQPHLSPPTITHNITGPEIAAYFSLATPNTNWVFPDQGAFARYGHKLHEAKILKCDKRKPTNVLNEALKRDELFYIDDIYDSGETYTITKQSLAREHLSGFVTHMLHPSPPKALKFTNSFHEKGVVKLEKMIKSML